jgi:hypothetical protein
MAEAGVVADRSLGRGCCTWPGQTREKSKPPGGQQAILIALQLGVNSPPTMPLLVVPRS